MKRAVYWFFHAIKQILWEGLNDIFLAVLFVEGFAQGTQLKELIIPPFIMRFKSFMTYPYSIETRPNQWFGFYMLETSSMKELKQILCEGLC